jgi:AraC-like DNA-binding protein
LCLICICRLELLKNCALSCAMMRPEDALKGLRLNALAGAEITCGRFRNRRIPKHHHDGLMLAVVDDGVQCVRYRGDTHRSGPGMLVAIPPEEVHASEPGDAEGWCNRTITIPTPLIQSLTGLGIAHFRCATVFADPHLAQMLARVFANFGQTPIMELEELLQAALTRFMMLHVDTVTPIPPRVGAEAHAVARCKAYLTSRMDQNVHLSDLEIESGLDRFRLVKSFTRLDGLPPHAWHIQQRVRRARVLLSSGATVAEAAYATGFADQAHFTRTFKKLRGMTPGYYRRGHLSL